MSLFLLTLLGIARYRKELIEMWNELSGQRFLLSLMGIMASRQLLFAYTLKDIELSVFPQFFLEICILVSSVCLIYIVSKYNQNHKGINALNIILETIEVAIGMTIASFEHTSMSIKFCANVIYITLPAFALYQLSQTTFFHFGNLLENSDKSNINFNNIIYF